MSVGSAPHVPLTSVMPRKVVLTSSQSELPSTCTPFCVMRSPSAFW